jgi:hypothetical protein
MAISSCLDLKVVAIPQGRELTSSTDLLKDVGSDLIDNPPIYIAFSIPAEFLFVAGETRHRKVSPSELKDFLSKTKTE